MLEKYFKQEGELFVGYHVEGGETFELSGSVPLNLNTLRDDFPLFIANNPNEWFPHHLENKDEYKVYKILFERIPFFVFSKQSEYMKNTPYPLSYNDGKLRVTDMTKNEIHLFILDRNDEGELTESYLIYPSKHVRSITQINLPVC